jgi:hypothetical protein
MSGMGISLGGLEIATDYLYANPDFYEPELTEIKTTISKKPVAQINVIKPVRPKVSRDSIIRKFSIIQTAPKILSDETIESVGLIKNADDFDFSFDDIEQPKITEETVNEEDLAANNLMQQIMNMKSTVSNNEETSDNEEESLDDMLNDIEDEENETSETDGESLDDMLNNIGLDGDDENETSENEEESLDDMLNDIDLEDEEPSAPVKSAETKKMQPEVKLVQPDEDNDGIDLEDLMSEDYDTDIEETEVEQESIENDIDNIDIEAFGLNEEDEENEPEQPINQVKQEVKSKPAVENKNIQSEINEDIKKKSDDTAKDLEIKELKEELANIRREVQSLNSSNNKALELKENMASMQKEIQDRNDSNTKKLASEIKKEKDFIDDLISGARHEKTSESSEPKLSTYEIYSAMTIEKLFGEVRKYMIELGVSKKLVDISLLNQKFGEVNIRKLIQKSYLIKMGKGVTIGR